MERQRKQKIICLSEKSIAIYIRDENMRKNMNRISINN